MENATRAFYMAAAMLIAVMIMGVMFYVFRNGARLGATYEGRVHTTQVLSFNRQFDVYGKVTNQTGSEDGYSFIEKGNTASDVITCANLAMSINKENDYDERNNVQVIIDCDEPGVPDGFRGTYYVYPIPNQPKNVFIKDIGLSSARSITDFTEANSLDFYKFLKAYNNIRMVNIESSTYSSSHETVYQYYFDVGEDENGVANQGLTYNEDSGKINKIVFKVFITDNFDDYTGPWTEAR